MNEIKISKLAVIALIVLGIGAVIAVLVWQFSSRSGTNPDGDGQPITEDNIVKTDVSTDRDPDKFPTGIPIEAGANVTQNYNATAKDGRFQATKVFETNRSLAENSALYQDWMTDDGWDIRSTVDQENYKMIFGVKGDYQQLQISIDNNETFNIRTVNISYTETR